MITTLLWIVGCYGLAVAAVHLMHLLRRTLYKNQPTPWMHVVLVTHNDERHMEWVIRAYCWFAWLKGRRLQFTIVDRHSRDATLPIVMRMASGYDVNCKVLDTHSVKEQEQAVIELQEAKQAEETVLVLHLSARDDWRRIPYVVGGAM